VQQAAVKNGCDLLTQHIPVAVGLENLLHPKVERVPEHELNI
jgi:hypothetical protein